MLSLSLVILSAAVVLGIALVSLRLRATVAPQRAVSVLHGALGAIGLAALVLALRGPTRGVSTGVASFGAAAALLAAIVLFIGLGLVAVSRRSSNAGGVLIALHATLAITAYALLLAYVSLG
jgi:hypothetical protein